MDLEQIRHYRKRSCSAKSAQSILASEKVEDAAEFFRAVCRERRSGNFETVEVISLNGNNVFEMERQESEL